MLVRVAIHGMPVSLLLKFLPHVEFTDENLSALQRELESIDFKEQLCAPCAATALGA